MHNNKQKWEQKQKSHPVPTHLKKIQSQRHKHMHKTKQNKAEKLPLHPEEGVCSGGQRKREPKPRMASFAGYSLEGLKQVWFK